MGLDLVVVGILFSASGCFAILGVYFCNKYICDKIMLNIDPDEIWEVVDSNTKALEQTTEDDIEATGEVIEDNAE